MLYYDCVIKKTGEKIMIELKLSELRKRNGMTQQELGDILSVSYKTISKWENGTCLPDIN